MKFTSNKLRKVKFCKWTFIILVILSSSYTYVMVVSSNALLFYEKLNFVLLENITRTPEYYDVLRRNINLNKIKSKHVYPVVSSKVFSTVKPPTKTLTSTITKPARRIQNGLNREVRNCFTNYFFKFFVVFSKKRFLRV